MADSNQNNSTRELTAWEETEADEHRQDVTHAQDIVQQVRCPEEQRRGNPEGREVSEII